jgi:hypothetical protein
MEILLNLAWAVGSLALIWIWLRGTASNPAPRRTQILALAMVVILLLPVISLSDDLMAMQGPAETDSSLRKAQHPADSHPVPASSPFGLPEVVVDALQLRLFTQSQPLDSRLTAPAGVQSRALDSRPPPRV